MNPNGVKVQNSDQQQPEPSNQKEQKILSLIPFPLLLSFLFFPPTQSNLKRHRALKLSQKFKLLSKPINRKEQNFLSFIRFRFFSSLFPPTQQTPKQKSAEFVHLNHITCPKSASLSTPSSETNRLLGFMSRCTIIFL